MTSPRQHVKNAAGFVLVWLIAKVAHRVRFRAGEIPRTGPVILVANHLTMTDPLAVARVTIGHRCFPRFLALQEISGWPCRRAGPSHGADPGRARFGVSGRCPRPRF